MNIAIIEDERPARCELRRQILEILPDTEIAEASSGIKALELLGKEKFDIVFVDIELRDMKGTVLAAALLNINPDVQIVFATAYSEYAVEAFEIGASDYIMKPFHPERVEKVLMKCQARINQLKRTAKKPVRLTINSNRKTTILEISRIIYIETDLHGCVIHTKDGDYTENMTITSYEKKLIPCGFYRIHKSYLVNICCISELFLWYNNSFAVKIKNKDETTLPVGRDKLKGLRQLLNGD